MTTYQPPLYAYSEQFSGVAAANVFFALTNPSASGRAILTLAFIAQSSATGSVTDAAAIRMRRATAVSGGTLLSNATAVAKFITTAPDSVVEVRTSNPTVTLGTTILSVQSIESIGTGSSSSAVFQTPTGGPGAILLPGESLVLRTASGDTDQRWNLNLLWSEAGI